MWWHCTRLDVFCGAPGPPKTFGPLLRKLINKCVDKFSRSDICWPHILENDHSILDRLILFVARSSLSIFQTMFYIFEPTCAYARWAHMHRFLSVCNLTKIHWEKIHNQESFWVYKPILPTWVHLLDEARGLDKVHETGRWAYLNVKLLHYLLCQRQACPFCTSDARD